AAPFSSPGVSHQGLPRRCQPTLRWRGAYSPCTLLPGDLPRRQEDREMKLKVSRLVTAGVVVGLLGIGGAGRAYAQSSPTSPTTPPGNAPAPNNGGGGQSTPNCPNMGGGSGGSTSSSSSSTM